MLAWQRTRTSTATSSEGSFAETPSGYIGPRCETRNVACLAVPSFSPQHCEALLCWRCPREIDRNRNVACATHRAFRALATASPTSKDRAQQGMEVQMKRNSPAAFLVVLLFRVLPLSHSRSHHSGQHAEPTPEPGTLLLLATGLTCVIGARRRSGWLTYGR